jgi:predicted acetyltransferase
MKPGPRFRLGGVGAIVARELFSRHRGTWHVHQVAGNGFATEFSRRAIPMPFAEEVDDASMLLQRFGT